MEPPEGTIGDFSPSQVSCLREPEHRAQWMHAPLEDCGPITRWALTAGTPLDDTGPPDLPEAAWSAELPVIVREGLSPVVASRLPSVISKSRLGSQLRQQAFQATAQTVLVVESTTSVLERFKTDGLPFVVIKGPAVRQWHPQPSQRCFSDIDVVVEPASFKRALLTAERLGFRQQSDVEFAWPVFPSTVMEGMNVHSAGGGNLDVHHHLSPWVFSRQLPASQIMASAEPVLLGSSEIRTASPSSSIVIAALHILNDLWKGKLALQSWRDILIIGEVLGATRVRSAFADCNCEWLLGLLSVALHEVAPRSLISQLAEEPSITGPLYLRLRLLGWGGPTVLSTQGFSWAARLPSTRALLFLLGSMVPSPAYVREQDGGYLRYWTRCIRQSRDALAGIDARMLTARARQGRKAGE